MTPAQQLAQAAGSLLAAKWELENPGQPFRPTPWENFSPEQRDIFERCAEVVEKMDERFDICKENLRELTVVYQDWQRDISTLRSQLDEANKMLGGAAQRTIEDWQGSPINSSEAVWERCAAYWHQNAVVLSSQLDALKAEVVRKDSALRVVEYCGTWNNGRKDVAVCPVCEHTKGFGHADNCNLALALTPPAMDSRS